MNVAAEEVAAGFVRGSEGVRYRIGAGNDLANKDAARCRRIGVEGNIMRHLGVFVVKGDVHCRARGGCNSGGIEGDV